MSERCSRSWLSSAIGLLSGPNCFCNCFPALFDMREPCTAGVPIHIIALHDLVGDWSGALHLELTILPEQVGDWSGAMHLELVFIPDLVGDWSGVLHLELGSSAWYGWSRRRGTCAKLLPWHGSGSSGSIRVGRR